MNARPAMLTGPGVSLDSAVLIGYRSHVLRDREKAGPLSMHPGGFVIRRRGNGQDIADSRIYVGGDDLRHIDRGATSRTGVLHTRTFQEERDRVTLLVADFRPSMLWGIRRAFRSVAAAEALTLLGWQAIEAGGRVGLLAITGHDMIVIPVRGRIRAMLNVIGGMVKAHDMALDAALDGLTEPQLDRCLEGLKRIAPNGSQIIIATGMETPGKNLDDLLGELARHRYPQLLIVEDTSVGNLPPGNYPMEFPDGTRIHANVKGPAGGLKTPGNDTPGIPKLYVNADMPFAEFIRQFGMRDE
ncbi:MAG: DUF58 domain-containing protein [Hyphomicrobiales bacterium]|nr:DUF58 domain-containing protein [Hyphomicrobiales bacterium]